jgi:hypothetical protein
LLASMGKTTRANSSRMYLKFILDYFLIKWTMTK